MYVGLPPALCEERCVDTCSLSTSLTVSRGTALDAAEESAVTGTAPRCVCSRDIAAAAVVADDGGDGTLSSADRVLEVALSRPDVFLFLGEKGLPPKGGIGPETPITLRPLSVAPGATGAFGSRNSPTPKTIDALGRIVPRGIWVPVTRIESKLPPDARSELAACGLSLTAVARAHGRLLYVHPDGDKLRKFVGDAELDDVTHFALVMIREVIATLATPERPDVMASTLLETLPKGVSDTLRLDGIFNETR